MVIRVNGVVLAKRMLFDESFAGIKVFFSTSAVTTYDHIYRLHNIQAEGRRHRTPGWPGGRPAGR